MGKSLRLPLFFVLRRKSMSTRRQRQILRNRKLEFERKMEENIKKSKAKKEPKAETKKTTKKTSKKEEK